MATAALQIDVDNNVFESKNLFAKQPNSCENNECHSYRMQNKRT